MAPQSRQILIVYNPSAGNTQRKALQRLIEKQFRQYTVDILESDSADVTSQLASRLDSDPPDLVVAAGGDGTIASVAAALVHREVTMGILPLGTGNVLSRELEIPLRPEQAAQLLAGDFHTRCLDVMRVGQNVYLLAVSAGLSAATMRNTSRKDKKRFGRFAYIGHGILNLFGIPQRNYEVELDGRILHPRANEVLVANAGIIGYRQLRWGPDVEPDDGHLDLCFVRARTGLDYLRVLWRLLTRAGADDERLNRLPVRQKVVIRQPAGVPVQADGDAIGHTPIEIELVPAALKVAVPFPKGR